MSLTCPPECLISFRLRHIMLQVQVGVRLNTAAGLGSAAGQTVSMDKGANLTHTRRKAQLKIKTQRRYEKAKVADVFGMCDDDNDNADGHERGDESEIIQ